MSRRNIEAPEPEEVKGKYKETMKGMFDTKAKTSQSHHEQMMMALNENKKQYDRNLYSDWLLQVYSKCANLCLKEDKRDTQLQIWGDDQQQNENYGKLKQVEIQCGKNCIRKFDKGYKLFDNIEKTIFEKYIKDSDVDPNEIMRAMQQKQEQRTVKFTCTMATFSMEKGQLALRLYRRIMKLHIRNMPNELRYFGDLYVKQEFRQHLDKASEDQMDKFLVGWNAYADQIKNVNPHKPKELKKQLVNEEFDELFKDKFNEEQVTTLKEFKDLIYESEKKKKQRNIDAAEVK